MLVRPNDAFAFAVPDGVVDACGTLRTAKESSAEADPILPVPNVSSAAMAHIVHFYTKLCEFTHMNIPPASVATFKARFFHDLARSELFEVMEAANYLDAAVLLDDSCAYVADAIRGYSPERIREFFMLPQDMTTEEARLVAERFDWAIK